MSNYKSILVRSPNWIGDQVLAFPFFYYLRKKFPDAHIASVCVSWTESIQYKTLIDEVIILEKNIDQSFLKKFKHLDSQALKIKAKRNWDLAISLPNSFSAAWLLYRTGANLRRGYDSEGRGLLLNDKIIVPDEQFQVQHRADSYLSLLPDQLKTKSAQKFWGEIPENDLDEPIPGELPFFNESVFWPENQLTYDRSPYWILAPGATADSRRWPMEYFIALSKMIYQKTKLKGLVVGGPKEAPLAERLCADDDLGLVDFTARGPVSSLVQLFRNSKFTVCNESGLAHVASLSGTFTQIVCGAADPRRTKPIGPGQVQVSLNAVECWPCEKNICSQPLDKKIQCLKGIKPEIVWEEIQRGLRQSS